MIENNPPKGVSLSDLICIFAMELRYQFDKAKPFRSRHAQQIKLIDEPVLPVRDLDTLYQEIMQAISPILALVSEKRAPAIRQYLKYRLHYLKAAMG